MKKLLAVIGLLFLTIPAMAQRPEFSWNGVRVGGTRFYQDARVFEVEYDPLYKEDSLVEYTILPDEQFQVEVEKYTKREGVYAAFYLPAGSDKTFVYVKKSCVKAKYIREILSVRDKLYIRYTRVEMRQGYSDVFIETNSLGGYKYRRENNWVSGLDGLQVIGEFNPVVILRNGFYPDKFPMGSPPYRQQSWIQRISRDKESTLFLAEGKPDKSPPPVVPVPNDKGTGDGVKK